MLSFAGTFIEPNVDLVTTFTVDKDITIKGIFVEVNSSKYVRINSLSSLTYFINHNFEFRPQLIDGKDDGVFHCRLLDSNGTLLGSAYKRMNNLSSALWDPVLIQSVRVKRGGIYRIIIGSVRHRAYFHIGMNLSTSFYTVQVSFSCFYFFHCR